MILDGTMSVSNHQLIKNLLALMKLFFYNLDKPEKSDDAAKSMIVTINFLDVVIDNENYYTAQTSRILLFISDVSVKALLDTGTKINVMTSELAEVTGLPI